MTWDGHRFLPGAPINGNRTIGSVYTPSATRHVDHYLTLQLVCTAGQTVTVQLLVDSATTPTTVRGIATSNVVGTIDQQLCWTSFPGENVKLVATGTGAATIAAQWEIPRHAAVE